MYIFWRYYYENEKDYCAGIGVCGGFFGLRLFAEQEQNVIHGFMNGLKIYSIDEMTNYIESFPNSDNSIYVNDVFSDPSFVEVYKEANTHMSYTIADKKVDGAAVVTVTFVDIQKLYADTVAKMFTSANTDENLKNLLLDENTNAQELISAYMLSTLQNSDVETVTEEFRLTTYKDGNSFKIRTDDELKELMTGKLSLSRNVTLDDIASGNVDTNVA